MKGGYYTSVSIASFMLIFALSTTGVYVLLVDLPARSIRRVAGGERLMSVKPLFTRLS